MRTPRDLLAHLSVVWDTMSTGPVGLITDVDGTISPIVDRPESARVHDRVPDLLGRLAARLELVAVVSGRPIEQLLGMLPVDGLLYVGDHGLEWWDDGRPSVLPEARPYLSDIADTVRFLRYQLDEDGVLVEEKSATAAVHYRLSPGPTVARMSILDTIARCPWARRLRVSEGRMVVNLLPPVHADKGTAVERLVRLHRLRGVIYLGDDVTDVDAFRVLRGLRQSAVCDSLVVAVASAEAPTELAEESDYLLDGVESVVSFLERLVAWIESGRGQREV